MPRTILHVDMDAFYTSIEQRDHPEYLGKPVVVGADPKEGRGRGVVAAASYEARVFGVRSAMPISRAYRLCPGAIYLRGDMVKYVRVSQEIMEILASFTDRVEPISIDEAFLDLTGSRHLHGDGRAAAKAIKKRIQEQERLTASIGVAPNKFLAKVASDLKKPDGLVVVAPGEEESFLRTLPVERLWGVGAKTAEALHRLGLFKIGDVARLTPEELSGRFGKVGGHLVELARGIDDRPVVGDHEAKSIGHETTFAEDISDENEVRRTLLELSEAVARRLRKHGLEGRVVTLKFRDGDFVTETRALSLSDPTSDAQDLYRTALDLMKRIDTRGRKVRLLGISTSQLAGVEQRPRQLQLFAGDDRKDRQERLNRTLDELRERFGDSSPKRASLIHRGKRSPFKR